MTLLASWYRRGSAMAVQSKLWETYDSFAEAGVRNSQAPGIGRLAFLDGHLITNNLGRNIVALKTHPKLSPVSCFAETCFPGQDDSSQFDLDMHVFLRTTGGALLAANH